MEKLSRLLVGAAILLGPIQSHAGEFLVIGKVDLVTVLPKGHSRCQIQCPPNNTCVSNSCGCAEASIELKQGLLGEAPATLIVSEHLDEWCRLPMPPNDNRILLHGRPDGILEWSYLNSSGARGSPRFEAERFSSIGGVQISEFPAIEGEVELGELEHRLGLQLINQADRFQRRLITSVRGHTKSCRELHISSHSFLPCPAASSPAQEMECSKSLGQLRLMVLVALRCLLLGPKARHKSAAFLARFTRVSLLAHLARATSFHCIAGNQKLLQKWLSMVATLVLVVR